MLLQPRTWTLAPVVIVALASGMVLAQPLTFEVASVKASPPPGPASSSRVIGPGMTGTTVQYQNVALRVIIADAYELDVNASAEGGEPRLVGGPGALLNRAFDIQAQAPPGATAMQKRLMLQTLLADRFRLKIRREVRQTPLYVLTLVGREPGPGLKRSALDCASVAAQKQRADHPNVATPCNTLRTEYTGGDRPFRGAGPLAAFVRQAAQQVDRPLIDDTGLSGNYEWSTRFRRAGANGDAPEFVEAVRRDLGLRITPKTGPYDVFVIDSVAMPTAN